jgi:hypothetical protein
MSECLAPEHLGIRKIDDIFGARGGQNHQRGITGAIQFGRLAHPLVPAPPREYGDGIGLLQRILYDEKARRNLLQWPVDQDQDSRGYQHHNEQTSETPHGMNGSRECPIFPVPFVRYMRAGMHTSGSKALSKRRERRELTASGAERRFLKRKLQSVYPAAARPGDRGDRPQES